MKKRLCLFMLAVALLFVVIVNVGAETIDVTTETELKNCVAAAGTTEETKSVCKLGNDIELTDRITIENGEYVEIILGEGLGAFRVLVEEGADVGVMFNVKGGVLKLTGPGGIFASKTAIQVLGNYTKGGEAVNAEVIVGEDVQVISQEYVAVLLYGKGAKLDVYGTIETKVEGWTAISGNGTVTDTIDYGNTVINIYDGAVVKNEKDTAIYQPQSGEINIYGGEVTGTTGIEMRAGKITVKGGTITGTAVPTTTNPNGSGTTTKGAGIAIVQHTTVQTLAADVSGGTVKGHTAFYHNNTENNSDEAVAKVTLEVTDGIFEAINGGENAIYSDAKENFVEGGEFKGEVDEKFVSEELEMEVIDGVTYVGESIPKSTIIETTDEKISFESGEAFPNNFVLVVEEVKEEDTEEVVKEVAEKFKDNTKVEDVKLLTLYDISVEKNGVVQPMEDGKFKISIEIAEDLQKYDTYKVVYINEVGKVGETLDAKLIDGKIVFETTHLSTYGIVGYNNVEVKNPETGDNVFSYILIGLMSLIAFGYASNKLRKNA